MEKIKIQSFNVNGLRAISGKGFLEWLQEFGGDIVGLQETKAWEEQLKTEIKQVKGYHPLMISKPCKKGYSGVGIYAKYAPQSFWFDFFKEEHLDCEGRVIGFETPYFTLFNVYFPNGVSGAHRLEYKMQFYHLFLQECKNLLKQGKNLIVMGDVNTAHKEIDLAHPKENSKSSGFLPIERAWIDEFIGAGFVDSFRHFYPEKTECYSWWDFKTRARERNVGWRIDYIFVSQGLLAHLKQASILTDIMGSDHCPVEIELEF